MSIDKIFDDYMIHRGTIDTIRVDPEKFVKEDVEMAGADYETFKSVVEL